MDLLDPTPSRQAELENPTGIAVRFNNAATLPTRRRKGPHSRLSDLRPSHPVTRPAVAPEPTVILPEGNRNWAYQAVKRGIDIVGAVVALILFAPVMLFALAVLVV